MLQRRIKAPPRSLQVDRGVRTGKGEGGRAVQLSWARNNLSELQTINLTLRFNSISIVTSAFGRSRRRRRRHRRSWQLCPRLSLSMSLRASTSASFCTFGNALSGGTQD